MDLILVFEFTQRSDRVPVFLCIVAPLQGETRFKGTKHTKH